LITVPSCRRCNGAASKDDEYFRAALAVERKAGDHSAAKAVVQSVLRSLANPKKQGFARAFLRATYEVDAFTPSGLYAGKTLAYTANLRRLDRVVVRIVKGLFYHEFGHRFPDSHCVAAWSESGLEDLQGEDRAQLQSMCAAAMNQPVKMTGADVLRYWFVATSEDPLTMIWVLQFYGEIRFVAMTGDKSRMASVTPGCP
jgi:hypothetical protein